MRIIIIDDNLIIRAGVTQLLAALGHDVVATADRPEQAEGLVTHHHPHVVIIDIRMPPTYTEEGLTLAAALRTRHPTLGILVLSQYVVPFYALTLLEKAPAHAGYLLKPRLSHTAILQDALERIHHGGTVIDPALVDELLRARHRTDPLHLLTNRERHVLQLMAEGLSDRGIAERLRVSANTISTHVQHVYDKLGLPGTPVDNRRIHAVLQWLRSLP